MHLPPSEAPSPLGSPVGSTSPAMRHLLDRIRQLGYGTVRGLHVRAGNPIFDPAPTLVRSVRLSEGGPPSNKSKSVDFVLTREQIAFQCELAAIGTGMIDIIKVHDGLPVGLEIDELL